MDASLERVYASGREAWPELVVPPRRFAEHLAAHLPDAPDAREAYLRSVHSGDLYLACACAIGAPGAAAALDRTVLSRIPSFLSHLGGTAAFVADARQAVGERLLIGEGGAPPKIAEYAGRAPLAAWVRVAAVRTALNLRRAVRRDTSLDSHVAAELASPGASPELDYLKTRYAKELKEAIHRALRALPGEQRMALRLHYVDGATGAEIASLLRIDRSTVVRWLARAREELFTGTRRIMTDELGLGAGEFDSIADLVKSRLELSLARVLDDADP